MLAINILLSLLLSLVPPSCIVVPIRELANKHFSTISNIPKLLNMAKRPSDTDIDIDDCNSVVKN